MIMVVSEFSSLRDNHCTENMDLQHEHSLKTCRIRVPTDNTRVVGPHYEGLHANRIPQ
jgi:hypothetical protein